MRRWLGSGTETTAKVGNDSHGETCYIYTVQNRIRAGAAAVLTRGGLFIGNAKGGVGMDQGTKRFVTEYCRDQNVTLAAVRLGIDFPSETGGKYYVYFLCDSRNGKIFYVGKGKNTRIHRHVVRANGDSAKDRMIRLIQKEGGEVREVIFRNDLDEKAAFRLERELISTLRKTGLTNILRGTEPENLNPRQRAFVEAYAGNATEAAIKAGYSAKTARAKGQQLLTKIYIQNALKAREPKRLAPLIASREERQAFWTDVMKDESQKMTDRLKAAELLGKSECDFTERVEMDVSGSLGLVILPESKLDG